MIPARARSKFQLRSHRWGWQRNASASWGAASGANPAQPRGQPQGPPARLLAQMVRGSPAAHILSHPLASLLCLITTWQPLRQRLQEEPVAAQAVAAASAPLQPPAAPCRGFGHGIVCFGAPHEAEAVPPGADSSSCLIARTWADPCQRDFGAGSSPSAFNFLSQSQPEPPGAMLVLQRSRPPARPRGAAALVSVGSIPACVGQPEPRFPQKKHPPGAHGQDYGWYLTQCLAPRGNKITPGTDLPGFGQLIVPSGSTKQK